jgi:hypothetical protein
LNQRVSQFGSGSNLAPWRALLTGPGRSHLAATRDVLGRLLDAVAAAEGNLGRVLEAIPKDWLDATVEDDGLGWRWYLVKYGPMREGRSGIYVGLNGALDYSVCMLEKIRMNGWYRDPYLLAIYRESGVEADVEDPWFMGFETEPRWMRLKRSGTEMQCVENGLVLRPPPTTGHSDSFVRVCKTHGVGDDHVLHVPQVEHHGRRLDTRDRVQLGGALLRDLVNEGL